MSDTTTAAIISDLGFEAEIARLRTVLSEWVDRSSPEMREMLEWQFVARSKYFRPLTMFACWRAVNEGPPPDTLIRSAAVLEMMHNVSLVIDDILDQSPARRGKATLHHQFGLLPALMASGYIVAEGYAMSAQDPYDVDLFSDLLKRLGVAECLQWRLRRQPLGVDDWLQVSWLHLVLW